MVIKQLEKSGSDLSELITIHICIGGANLQYGGSVFHCCHTLGVINSGLIEGTSARIHSTLKRFPTTCDQANNATVYCNIYIQQANNILY